MSYVLFKPSRKGIENRLTQGMIVEDIKDVVETISETNHSIDGVNFSRVTIRDKDDNIWVGINCPEGDKT